MLGSTVRSQPSSFFSNTRTICQWLCSLTVLFCLLFRLVSPKYGINFHLCTDLCGNACRLSELHRLPLGVLFFYNKLITRIEAEKCCKQASALLNLQRLQELLLKICAVSEEAKGEHHKPRNDPYSFEAHW